ncbi:hypothetical protein HJG53_15665 [Sphingomonas sp. ID1715]|uniref:hypothetical protein n=1 Tax=Sphingomonas sp. ID1715 TaxID=1656898 RepID=UPI001489ABD4|nr:hypothetical protein [Sphingomonas sp. ID1715]NNM78330.1 hypothetical protein [Sphingomonas sp. ID1715]
MAGILITLVLSMGMLAAIWLLLRPRRNRRPDAALPNQLSAEERRRLYKSLGLDPQAMSRGDYPNVVWLDSRRAQKRGISKV